ncbi:MAG: InlB B-repeat-containing protein, partial [Clostridia bacterium]|nr:InlB B-repeat-containing protein [Clostridia bacterium]
QTGSQYNYYKFTPDKTSTYTLNVAGKDSVYVYKVVHEKEVYSDTEYKYIKTYEDVLKFNHQNPELAASWLEECNYTYDLTGGETYYFIMRNNTDAYFTYTLSEEVGLNEEAPALIIIDNKTTTLNTNYRETTKYYRLYCDFALTFDITSNYSINFYTYSAFTNNEQSITEISLSKGVKTYVVTDNTSIYSGSVNLVAQLDNYTYGSSILESVNLSDGDAVEFVYDSTSQLTNNRYFKYANNTDTSKTFVLYAGNYEIVRYSVKGFKQTEDNYLTKNYTTIILQPYETLYGICELSSTKTTSIAILSDVYNERTTLGNVAQIKEYETGNYSIEITNYYTDGTQLTSYVMDSSYSKINPVIYNVYKLYNNKTYYIVTILPINLKTNILNSGIKTSVIRKYSVSITSNIDNSGTYGIDKDVTVTFNSNGGSDIAPQTITKDTALIYPQIPTRSNYVFTGWYTDQSCQNVFDFTSPVYENITLFAGWEYVSTSSYYSRTIIDSTQYNSSTNRYYTSVSSSSSFSNAYYVYTSFLTSGRKTIYYKNDQTSYSYATYLSIYNETQGTTIKSDDYFYSTSYYSVSFNVNAGDIIKIKFYDRSYSTSLYMYFDGATTPLGGNLGIKQMYAIKNTTFDIFAVPKLGYKFVGWYIGENLLSEYETYAYYGLNSDIQIEAKWEKLSQHNLTINSDYTQIALFEINSANLSSSVVTFDSNGGSDISSQTVTPTTKLEYPTVPTRNHYVFTGWYTEKSCENLFNFTDPVFEDMTLYAGWEYASASAYYSKIIIDSAQYNSSSDYYYTNISNSSYSGNAYYVYTTFLTSGTKTIYFKNNQSSYNYATYLSIYNQTKATTIRSESYFYTSNYDSVSFEVDAGDIIRIKFYDYNYSTCLYMYFENAVYPTNTDYTISSKIYAECYVTVEYELLYEDNFEFLGWYDGDILLSTDLKYIILMPNKDYTITAKWEYIY